MIWPVMAVTRRIEEFWMPDQIRHDKMAPPISHSPELRRCYRTYPRYTIFNFGFIQKTIQGNPYV